MDHGEKRIILVDGSDQREALAERLRAQGYVVDVVADAATGADHALSRPPAAVVADLWMPTISGVQLCRLLKSEPATMDVPMILRGESDEPRNRFWAERAGAHAYVARGRMGDLVRALGKAVEQTRNNGDGFFLQLSGGTLDIRDRIARHLDAALFDSVIAAEVRALASAGSFDRLFDQLAQFLSQVTRYRWLALSTTERLAIHHHPAMGKIAEAEARTALAISEGPIQRVEDGDAAQGDAGPSAIVATVCFAGAQVARVALAPCEGTETEARDLCGLVARELGGPLRMAALVEESQRLAATDVLTGLMNRRAFVAALNVEISRSGRHEYPLGVVLLDIDHFKLINDHHGHPAGDRVIAAIGALLRNHLRCSDHAARWGGEEFVVALTSTAASGVAIAAERIRFAIEALDIKDADGGRIPVTASLGVTMLEVEGEESLERLVDRADRAMYASKSGGRNRVTFHEVVQKVA